MSHNITDEFASIRLDDSRRDERLLRLAERLTNSPGTSIHGACKGWSESKAAYRLLQSGHLSMEKLIDAHAQCSLARARNHGGSILLVQDTTELDFTTHKALRGHGPLSAQSRRGFFSHERLMIAETEGVILGIEGVKVWAREDREHGKAAKRKSLPIEDKESIRWLEGYLSACALAEELLAQQIVMVGDRECDIYEVYECRQQRVAEGKAAADFIVRAKTGRLLHGCDARLFEELAKSKVLGSFTLEITQKEQIVKIKGDSQRVQRQARTALVEVRAMEVTLNPPARPDRKLSPVKLNAVLVREKNPPQGQEPIEWMLLSTLAVSDFQEVMRIVRAYTRRWRIEEFHRVLKTGCRVEEIALRQDNELLINVAFSMVIAWRILFLRDFSRECAEAPASMFFEEVECRILCVVFKRPMERAPLLLKEVMTMIARAGGYAARKSEPPAGAQCIWRGLIKLAAYVEVAEALDAFPR